MKRFEASVENMLIGKYGIARKNESYYQVYDTYKRVQEVENCNKHIRPLELLGILEYELDRIVCKSPCCTSILSCKHCALVIGELEEAIKLVRAEITKLQGGVG
jgi:hypothetical protein